jgi:dihydroxyacetone kinase-like protein
MLDGLVAASRHLRPAGAAGDRAGRRDPSRSASSPAAVSPAGVHRLCRQGPLDACAIGNVFASPSAEQMADSMRIAHAGAGVLRLYGNYGGDVMNFDMAGETVEMENDIRSTTVLLADDVASAPPAEAAKRRGVAGMVYAFKIAGAKAEEMADLDAVTATAQKAADACRSIGMALTPCTVPQAGKPTFQIGEDEMEMGMGIHGEPGIWRLRRRCVTDGCWIAFSPTCRSRKATAPRS